MCRLGRPAPRTPDPPGRRPGTTRTPERRPHVWNTIDRRKRRSRPRRLRGWLGLGGGLPHPAEGRVQGQHRPESHDLSGRRRPRDHPRHLRAGWSRGARRPLVRGSRDHRGRQRPEGGGARLHRRIRSGRGGIRVEPDQGPSAGRSGPPDTAATRWPRGSIVLSTKYTNAVPGKDPNAAGNHRKSMFQAVEASLKRLQTEYIDLYWVHAWDQITPVEEVMRGLDDLVRLGKVLYVGISDAPAWWIAQANTLAHLRGWSPFIGLQIEYSLIERTVERELIPMAKALNIGVTAWSPLAGGVLTGKYHGQASSDQKGEQARLSSEMMKDFLPEQHRADRVVAAVKSVADEAGRSLAQVALAWLRSRPVPVIPIIGRASFLNCRTI